METKSGVQGKNNTSIRYQRDGQSQLNMKNEIFIELYLQLSSINKVVNATQPIRVNSLNMLNKSNGFEKSGIL